MELKVQKTQLFVKKENKQKEKENKDKKNDDKEGLDKQISKWYDGKVVQWIFCTFIPFAFLAAYPIIILSYYTIAHTVMAQIFVLIALLNFYVKPSDTESSIENKEQQLKEIFIKKQTIQLKDSRNIFFKLIMILESLNILSKIIFVIIYYTKEDMQEKNIKNVLLDLEFFFVSDLAKQSGLQKAKMILLSFIPNILLFSVFLLASRIYKSKSEVRIEELVLPSNQNAQGLLNFLVLVSLASCQIFNPSIMAFGFLGLSLVSQIISLISSSQRRMINAQMTIQALIQIYCFAQFFLNMFSATNTFQENQYFESQFIGVNSIAEFSNGLNQHPFYILSLTLLFFLSVFYLQKLNYERSRWSFIPAYQQIEKEKKKNRLKKALVQLLILKKKSSSILETKSQLLQRFGYDNNNYMMHYNTINDQDKVQIELQTYNDIRTEQQILQQNQDQSQDKVDLSKHLRIQETAIDDKIQDPSNQEQNAKRKQKMTNSLKVEKAQVNFRNVSNSEIQLDDNKDNENQLTILSKIRKNNKSTTYTPGIFLKKQQNNQKRGSFRVNKQQEEQIQQVKAQKKSTSIEEQKERGIEIIRQQLIKIEKGEDDNMDNFMTAKKQDILYEESIEPDSYQLSNLKKNKDKFSALKAKLQNYILEISSRSFTYIKSQFEDSIIPIRFLQCCSILIIMRYPCYYSLGLITWCLLSSVFKLEIKIKFLFIILVPIPCIIIIYTFNLYGSIKVNHNLYPKHGFVYQRFFWLESIIFNTIIFLFFTYLLILRRLKQNLSSFIQQQKDKSQEKKGESNNNIQDKQNLDLLQIDNSKNVIEQNSKQIDEQNNDFIFQRNSEKQESAIKKNSLNQDLVRIPSKSDPIKAEINLRFSKQSNSSIAKLKQDQDCENEQNQRFQSSSCSNSGKQEISNKNNQKIEQSQQKPVSLMTIFFAFILKYSQTLALFLLYWIGFYTINIIHLLLVVLFLIFFQNSLKTIKIKKNGKIYVMSFSFKYWYILLIYLGMVIFAKFIYTILQQGMNYMGEENYNNNQDSYLATIFNFIGINYDYDMPFSLSLSKDDYASLSIIWIAFMFATLQEDTFRSETYQKYSNKIIFLIQDQPVVKKYCPNFLFYTNKITVLGENLIYWLSFFGITTCLILQDFSFINSFLLLLSFLIVFYYIFKYKEPQLFKYKKYYKMWYLFNLIIIGYILLCYILQFTSLKFVQDYIIDPSSQRYKTFKSNRAVYGFYPELSATDNLRYTFFPIIFVLYFAIFVQNYLKMIYNAVKHHSKAQIRDKSESNCSVISDNQKKLLNERENITIDVINKNYQKARREENRQIYINYVLFDIYSEVSSGVYQILKGLKFIMIDIQNMLVFLFAMVFRLSISMLIFIIIYLKFFYRYHNQLETFLEKTYMKKSINYFFKSFQKFYSFPQKNLGWRINLDRKSNKNEKKQQEIQMQEEVIISSNQLKNIQRAKASEAKQKEQNQAENEQNKLEQQQSQKYNILSKNNKNLQEIRRSSKKDLLENKIQEKIQDFIIIQQKLKIDEQLSIWPYSFWFSYICISITYGSQFLATDYAKSNISNYKINYIQWAFFIFGTSCNTLSLSSIFRNIYFYLIMFWMNIIIFVLIRMKKQHEQNVVNYQKQELESQSQLNKNSQEKNSSMKDQDSSAKKGENNQSNPLNYDDFRLQKSPAINSEYPRNSSSYSQQLNRLTYLHLNQAPVSDLNNQEGEQKLAFESERLKRVQNSENEVEVIYYQEGGLLPQKITWCKLFYKHFKLTDEESQEEDENQDFIQKTQFTKEFSPNHKPDNIFAQQNNDKIDSIMKKNYDDAFKNEIENSIEDEGSINQFKNRLDGVYVFKVQSPNILRDQFEQKNQSDEEKKQELLEEIIIRNKNQQKLLDKMRAEAEEEKQKQIYREDPDFIYNNYLRIQYFYQMKSCYVKQKCKSALLLALYPFYSVILMHVSEQKHDIFSYIYLLVAFLGNSIKAINRNTIFLVLLQYILLLVNINQQTSPLHIDQYLLDFKNMSLIQQYITDQELLQYLAFNSSNQSNSATISFILNCLVFTVIGIYFNCYKYLINSIVRNIQKVKNKVKYIYENNLFPQQIVPISIYKQDQIQKKQQENLNDYVNNPDSDQNVNNQIQKNQKSQQSNHNISTYSIEFTEHSDSKYDYQYNEDGQLINPIQPLWINYQNWKSQSFQFANLLYEISISFGYIICAVLIMIISCQYLDIFNFIILTKNMIIFFVIEFVVPFPQMLNQRKRIQNLLRVLQFYLYAVFALYSTIQIPYVRNNISATGYFLSYQFLNLKIIDKIYIMFCIMCTQLLISSQDFKIITFSVSQSYILNANLSHKALSIQLNDQTISELLKNEKERRSLREVVRKVTLTLKNWHKSQSYVQSSHTQQQNNQNKNLNTSYQLNQFQSSKNLQNILPARSQSTQNVPLSYYSNQINTRNDSRDNIFSETQGLNANQFQRGFQNKSKAKNVTKNISQETQSYQKDIIQQEPITQQNQEISQGFLRNDQNSPIIITNLVGQEKQEQNYNLLLQQEQFQNQPKQQNDINNKTGVNYNAAQIAQKVIAANDELDYSSDESLGNIDEINNMNSGIQIKKYDFLRISQIKINNLENLQQQYDKQDQFNTSNLKRMKISRVSSIDHLEQNLLFDQQSVLKRSINANQQKDTDSNQTTSKIKNLPKEKSVCFQSQKVQKPSRKKSLKDRKQEKANKYHNIENIQAAKKHQKDSDSESSEDSQVSLFNSSEVVDEEDNDLMDQIKQQFDKKIQKQKEEEEALLKGGKQAKRETSHKILIKICKLIESQVNPLLFMDTVQISDYILKNNCQIFSKIYINIQDLLLGNLTSLMEYSHLLSIVYYCIYQTIQEAGVEFAFNNLFAIIQRATECDDISKIIYDSLIETSSQYPTIPYYYHLRKQQEQNITDKRIIQREQRNNLDHICIYHPQIPMYIYNVKSTNSLPFNLLTKLGLIRRILKSFFKMVLSNWQFVCFFFFLMYYFSNSGLMSMPFPCLVFLNFLIEIKFVSLQIWMISFIYVTFLLIFKFIIQINGINMDTQLQNTFFNDNLHFSFEGYLIFLILVAQIMTKYIGMDKEDVYNSENIYQSYIRKCVNDLEFRQDFIENCLQPAKEDNELKNIDLISAIHKKGSEKPNLLHTRQMSQQQFDSDHLLFKDDNQNKNTQNLQNKQTKLEKTPSIEQQNEKRYNFESDNDNFDQLKKQPSLNKQASLQKKNSFKQNQQQFLEDQTLSEAEEKNKLQTKNIQEKSNQDLLNKSFSLNKNNLLSITEQERSISMHEQMLRDLKQKPDLLVNDSFKKENFFQRVFSNYNKRSGKDFYPWIALIQVIILLFIFIFYTRMDANNTQGINEQLKYNQFSGEMVICLFIQVAFMVFERYLALRRVSKKTKKPNSKKKKEKNSSNSDSSIDQDLSSSNNLSETQEEDSLLQNKQRSKKIFDSFEEKGQKRQNQPRSQSQVKRKTTFKKDVNIKHLRSSTKISQEYDTYKNFQEMQSQVLNQEEDEDLDNKKLNKNLKDELKQQSDQEEKQKDKDDQEDKKRFDYKDFEIVNEHPQIRVRSIAPYERNSKEYDEDVLKQRYQRRLSLVLRDEIIFANLEKQQINANLQNFKQYGDLITKNKDSNNLDSSLSSSDDQKSFFQDFSEYLSSRKSKNKKKINQNTPQNKNKKEQENDLENQIEETKKSSNQKQQDQMVSYPTDKVLQSQDEADAYQQVFNKQKIYHDSELLHIDQQQGIQSSQDEDNLDLKSDASDNISVKENIKEKPKESFVLTTELLKFIQLTVFIILFSWFVFFYIPQSFQKNTISDQKVVVNYSTNGYLIAFVFIVMIYLLLSTLQLRYGYKKLKLRNTILQSKNAVAGFCAVVVRAIPFLQELKVILDWTVTKTSLTLFQWFLLEDIHYSLYVAKLDSKDVRSTKVDAPQSKVVKIFLGLLQVIVILLLIFGPMLLFSTLNPISEYNGITSGEIEVGFQFTQKGQINYYPFFINSHTNNLQTVQRDCTYDPQNNNGGQNSQNQDCYWDEYKFRDVNTIYTSDSQQFQKFDFYSYSENSWDLSSPSKRDIENKFEDILNNPNTSYTAQLIIKLVLNRKVSQYNTAPYISYYPNPQIQNSSNLDKLIIQGIHDTLTDCQKPGVKLPNFYIFLLSSAISNQSYTSSPIIHQDNNNDTQFTKDSYLQLKCEDISNPSSSKYWEISLDQSEESGLSYFVLTDKYSNATFGFSIITLYTSVILVIGKFIRDAFGGELEKIIIKCMPNPDELLRICEAISNARNEKDLLKERILYFELMDLIRSPEVLKKLTGSYSFVLNQKHKLDLQQEEIEKAFKKRKRMIKKKLANKKKIEKQRLEKLFEQNKEPHNKEDNQHDEQTNNFKIEEKAEEEEFEEMALNQYLNK